jgi:hypothetical protein
LLFSERFIYFALNNPETTFVSGAILKLERLSHTSLLFNNNSQRLKGRSYANISGEGSGIGPQLHQWSGRGTFGAGNASSAKGVFIYPHVG